MPKLKFTTAHRDLLIIALLMIPAFWLASSMDAFESLVDWTRQHEHQEWDELITLSVLLTLAFGLFSARRWMESIAQLKKRKKAEQSLQRAHDDLELKVQQRTDELVRANQALQKEVEEREQADLQTRKLLEENRRLGKQSMELLEAQKRVWARELHDEFGQCLTAIQIDGRIIVDETKEQPGRIRDSAEAIVSVTHRMHDAMRVMVKQLRPEALDDLGLEDAIREFVDEWQSRNSALKYELDLNVGDHPISETVAIQCYRVLQECMNNINKYAQANTVYVSLKTLMEGDEAWLELQVQDDGCGFDPKRSSYGLGLIGIRERAEALAGTVAINSHPGKGTQVIFRARIESSTIEVA